jgi:hypothetical protein
MKQITVRHVHEEWIELAKRKAQARHVSLNQIFVEVLAKGLGATSEPATNGLEKFAGGADFGKGWDDYLSRDLQQIDEEMWK